MRTVSQGSSSINQPPTPGQQAFFEEVRALERRAAHVAASRRGSPEQIAICFLKDAMREAMIYLEKARAEGLELDTYRPGPWSSTCLTVRKPTASEAPAAANVVSLAAYRARRGGARG